MKTSRRQVIDDLIHDAHFGRAEVVTRKVAAEIVDELHGLEASGHEWVSEYLDQLAVKGAAKVYADWRRRYRVGSRTKKGTALDVPAYAAVRKHDDRGAVVFAQMHLEDMTLPQLEAKAERIGKTRDTLSVEYRFYRDLIELMQTDAALATAGDAIARLEAA
jgi:hypothetical protein